jgi:hypothetical protein
MMLLKNFILSAALIATVLTAQVPPSYQGMMKLPIELFPADGARLEPGEYNIEVKAVKGAYELLFLLNQHTIVSVEGHPLDDAEEGPALGLPIVGTHYMRSSAEPYATDAERQKSKTGLPPYQEEGRNWRAAIRVYRSAEGKEAVFLFDEKLPRGQWKKLVFKLGLTPRHNP